MLAIRTEASQTRGRILYAGTTTGLRRVGQHTDEPVLGERTSRLSILPIEHEPSVRRLVMYVRWIEQRDKHIHVEKSDHGTLRLRP